MKPRETIEDFEKAIAETLLELKEAKNQEYIDVLNHDLRRFRRAIRQLKAGA